MKKFNKVILVFIALVGFYSCKPNLEGFIPSSGNADFSEYVAIGNSLTAGYADGALSFEGQNNSFPMMLAQRFELAGGGEFTTPFLPAGPGNNSSGGKNTALRYLPNCKGEIALSPVPVNGTAAVLTNVAAQGPFNNIGVPGARAVDALSGFYSGANAFLARFCAAPGGSSILSEALRKNPTFFTMWLGNNDVLGYATGGGMGAVDPAFPFPGDLSNPAQVVGSIGVIVDSLSRRGAKGVIANIPDVTSIPFFTTIPWNGVMLTQGAADTLNALYAAVGHTGIVWKAGANPYIIEDTTVVHGSLRIRQARPDELILLTTPGDSIRCAGWGIYPTKALTDAYVLDQTEVADIKNHIAQYNQGIANVATTYKIAMADMNSYMRSFKSGIVYNGVSLGAAYITGGAFSLDAVHPNPRGYALIANEFIRVINSNYEARIPEVDVNSYSGTIFP